MPYKINKLSNSCKQTDGDIGHWSLTYTDKNKNKHRACHTSKKNAEAQIAAIEAPQKISENIFPTFKSHNKMPNIGEKVVNTNIDCKHFGSEGYVVSVDSLANDIGMTVSYCCTNTGNNWQEGDILTKTMDQVSPWGPSAIHNENISSDLLYHARRGLPMTENIFRPGSWKYFSVIREARELVEAGHYIPTLSEAELLCNYDIGEYALFEGRMVPLDFPMPDHVDFDIYEIISEAKYKDKEVKLGKPTRGDIKKYKVYVRDPKSGNVKKVEFGDLQGGLSAKMQDPKARANFVSRHNCAKKNDKTKAGYWSCRLPRYWKQLGLKKNSFKFW